MAPEGLPSLLPAVTAPRNANATAALNGTEDAPTKMGAGRWISRTMGAMEAMRFPIKWMASKGKSCVKMVGRSSKIDGGNIGTLN